jgi:uncharacterized protein (TIGR03000 family)
MAAKHARHAARRSGGSSGFYASSFGSSGGSSGGYGGSSGHYGSSGGGSSGGGSSGGGSSGGGSSGGSSGGGSSGGYSSGPAYSSRYRPLSSYDSRYSSIRTDAEPTYASGRVVASDSVASDEVQLMVNVPASAKVLVNGNATTSVGATRRFVSRDLNPSESYRFEVQATYTMDGKEVTQSRTVIARAGAIEEVTFEGASSDDPVETILTLSVPADAKVVLANNATKSDGTSRVFRTKQLKAGEAWEDYKIEVTHAGVTKEKTIRLIGGDKLEMTFQFEDHQANKVASN